ncbi:class I SAM-dependent methyltransferase [Flagellimonas allohymeniacidonis]|uniref:Class I SAM-dependent methyltransferase n=1 Tax=Flagellimonas allohymeniacidonis TaxID=2517819 RepID=A0A4Q8QEI9_9FLAO|nr:class I SAM-dependent methyltransferase [Allomuricauda hymeniacidonis]TAI48922.1 class I SAM-dependent methyltransferase [Allomuricauda hymeniacidonis]
MLKEKILKAYESLAEEYNAQIDHKPHNAYYDRPSTLALLEDVKGKSILDAACGPGKYAEILLKEGALIKGFDLSPKMIELAQRRNSNASDFFVHDLEKPLTMFKKKTFDTVLCALAMHYVKDWNATIQEFYRVLKPKGKVVISIEHPFFEYTYFKSKKYFEVEPVKCTWNSFGKPIEINSYRRPLFEIIQPFIDNGFLIEKLVEPKPVAEFQHLDPKHFKELNEFPAFMALRAVKGS